MQRVHVATVFDDLERSLKLLATDSSRVVQGRAVVERSLESGEPLYGINTGFGALAGERIGVEDLRVLQKNLLISHAVGVGESVPREIAHLMLLLKIHALGLGCSGVSLPTFDRLLLFAREGLVPRIPSRGSVGASGDLAPLAHLALPLIGQGEFWAEEGVGGVAAREELLRRGLDDVELGPKDGLALINGTQFMTAYGAFVLHHSRRLARHADVVAAMSLEALQGSVVPFDERIQRVRGHKGQGAVAANVRLLLEDSQILVSHRHCGKVQDPYSLRCVPQVHGASRDALSYGERVIETEMNSATDNPLVFEDGSILSGGNFHGQPVALALDFAAIALAELASISERRIFLLLAGHDGLPRLLMKETGVNSGFMMPQYTAAALVSENKVLCHPGSVDSIPTSMGQEDHVSMGSVSALKLMDVYRNVELVLAIEALTAAQALDYRLPLRPGRGVEIAHSFIRQRIPHRESDYLFQEDLLPCLDVFRQADLVNPIEAELGAFS
jgi:histidine ammonia-lyase